MNRRAPVSVVVAVAALLVAAGCSSDSGSGSSVVTLKPLRATTSEAASSTSTSAATASAPTGGTTPGGVGPGVPSGLETDQLVALVVSSLGEFWGRTFPMLIGGPYTPVRDIEAVTARTRTLTCGGEAINDAIVSGNALYCSDGDYIAYDAAGLIPELRRSIGDVAVLVVFAHEWGHSIAARAGFVGPTIGMEQQADCFAGSWAGDATGGTNRVISLRPTDLDQALAGLLQFRDPPETDPSSPGAHGSAFQRIDAFRRGFQGGAAACVDLHREPPVQQGTDSTAADAPLDTLIPLTLTALDRYWAQQFPSLGGGRYTTIPHREFRGSAAPACPGVDPSALKGHVAYCGPGDFVAWDDDLITALYERGDFAIAAAIADAWSAGILARLHVTGTSRDLALGADCLAGAWAGALSRSEVLDEQGNTVAVLSAGDLDEAIAGFLYQSGTIGADAAMQADMTSAFDRTAAFQQGFEGTVDTCVH